MANEGVSLICPLDLGIPLFLYGDSFDPTSVLFPHYVFYFPPKDKKESYDFADKVIEKHRRACDERQHLGLKRQTLEARIAQMERKMYLGSQGRVPDPNRVPVKVIPFDSEEGDEEEDINTWKRVKTNPRWATKPRRPLQNMEIDLYSTETVPDHSADGMIREEVPKVPDQRPPLPRGYFRSEIWTPCTLIKDLPERDQ
ncbi:hypothetical protein [Arabidopsis thaliana]|uniref:T6L9.5 protein n=1 Tax=Arabidopsis thaliana TaxID=3702 RepID=Q9XH18_ARATH|nr:hypothetical protein (DUF3287) [Arabidopsis thaliana]AAD38217.1 T6L9.5 gene product [Arabidopsis thaliana]AEE82578.1 hypothetical protein (DUF3287) [Arabidopsis thaliana]CAB77933.1 hypothetical protein [Arabidopsis thaliana]|eukprot:NP_192517.1 hypothetical protein (DUF3287) [Arabidopsis thaliana]